MNWIIKEDEDRYHAQSKNGNYMSSHMLSTFRTNPKLYYKKVQGLISDNDNPAYAIGRAAHKLILEGREAFNSDYVVSDGPINERTGKPFGSETKAFTDWRAEQTGEIVATANYGKIINYELSVKSHVEASALLQQGVAEGVVRAEYCGVPCQIRMDFFNEEYGLIDLKTCAEIRYFESDLQRYGYIYQLAFYRAVIKQVTGKDYPVNIIAVEKQEPYTCGVWGIIPNVLDEADMVNVAALKRYKQSKVENLWPTGYEQKRIITELRR